MRVILSYSHNPVAEIALEGLGLVSLHLPVLHGAAPERSVQLGDVHGRGPLLILGGILANPVVQIHSGAAGGPFGLEEVGRTSWDEDKAHFCVLKPSDHRVLSRFCLSPEHRERGRSLRYSLGARPGALFIQQSVYGFYKLN